MSQSTTVAAVIGALRGIPQFPAVDFVNRLYNKARSCGNVAPFQAHLQPLAPYGEDPNGPALDQVNASSYLELLAESSAVQALGNLDPANDKHKLKACANQASSQVAIDGVMTDVTSLLYAEYINWFLKSKGLPDLAALSVQPGFRDAFTKQLHDPHFISGEVYEDMAKGAGYSYSLALLFTDDYLHHGRGVVPSIDEDFSNSASSQTVSAWAITLSHGTSPSLHDVLAFCAKAASIVCATTDGGHLKPQPISKIARNIFGSKLVVSSFAANPGSNLPAEFNLASFSKSVNGALQTLSENDLDQWKSISAINLSLWGNFANKWNSAVSAASLESSSTTRDTSDQFGRGFVIGLTAGLEDHQSWKTTTITGSGVADWIKQGSTTFKSLFAAPAPNVTDVTTHNTDKPAYGGCFVAGTKVTLENGSIAIEKLEEDMRVLTNADSKSYGVVSDEDVVAPMTVPLLVAINDEPAFFTPGHVFHTTTGLRAVEPKSARNENPWLNVGKLGKGHVLKRLQQDGKSYEHVEIKSLRIETTKAAEVYGVHLREGQRSYHANGYLVAVNYPEITIKSIANLLSQCTRAQRVEMMKQIKELDPLFKKFGVATISAVLATELKGEKRRKVSRPLRPRKKHASHLRQAKRTYRLVPMGEDTAQPYRILPTVQIHEGVVRLDGAAEPRAVIDPDDLTIRWSRSLSDGKYEHGQAVMDNLGLTGSGVVLISSEAEPAELPSGKGANLIPFKVVKANVLLKGGSRNQLQHGQVANPPKANDVRPSSAPQANGITNFSPLKHRVPGFHPPSIPATVTSKGVPVTSPTPPVSVNELDSSDDSGTIDDEDYFSLTLDQSPWPAGTDRTTPVQPVSFGQIAIATYHTDGADGFSYPIVTVPLLDQLCAAINAATTGPAIETLYSSYTSVDNDGNFMGIVDFDSASVVAALSDANQTHQTLNLTFKKSLSSSIVLPILFRRLQFSLDWSWSNPTGTIYELDSTMQYQMGTRHLIVSNDDTSFATVHTRVANSAALVANAKTAVAATPAVVTKALAAATTQKSVGQLVADVNKTYNDLALHTTSQALLQQTMTYHMSDNDRTNFLQIDKPQNLDINLAQDLPSDLATWIQQTYAPAYVSFMLAQTPLKGERVNLTDDEKNKIWYWWSGSGSKCLSKTKEYNDLNNLTATAAMRQLYGSCFTGYLGDPNKNWAAEMYNGLINAGSLKNLCSPAFGQQSKIYQYCNMMYYLDSTGTYADSLFNAMLTYAMSKTVVAPYSGTGTDDPDKDQRQKWLYNAMDSLGQAIINNNGSIKMNEEIRQALLADLTEFEQQAGLDSKESADKRMEAILKESMILTESIADIMDTVSSGFGPVIRAFGSFKWATNVFDKMAAKLSTETSYMGTCLKGVMTFAMVGMYVFVCVSSFMAWDTMDAPAKATCVITTLQMAVNTVKDIADTYKRYKKVKKPVDDKNPPAPQDVKDEAVMDEKLEESIQESAPELQAGAETIYPNTPNPTQVCVADKISANGPETREVGALEPVFDEPILTEKSALLPSVSNAMQDAAKSFNTLDTWLNGINAVLGIALTVSLSLDLKEHWGDMNTVGKVLNIVQIVTTGLGALVGIAQICVDYAVFTGAIAEGSMMCMAVPFVGAVLAIIGVAVMITLSLISTQKTKEPPPTPVETFITKTGRPLIAGWDEAPSLALAYAASASERAHVAETYQITATNASPKAVTITSTTITVEVGTDAAALFSDSALTLTTDASATKTSAHYTYPAPGTLCTATMAPNILSSAATSYDITIGGVVDPKVNPLGQLVLQPQQSIHLYVNGTVNAAGTSTLQAVETFVDGDKARWVQTVTRT
ncbi:hypothetical protein MMC32_007811 [Xylographa parallela]|nr:hypothetical protein [Xylographa parallela]